MRSGSKGSLSSITTDLVRWGIAGKLPAYKPWLRTPKGASQSIDIIDGSSSVRSLTCEVIDIGGAIRTRVGTNTLEYRLNPTDRSHLV
ncbi:MAG: hypothetical protein ACLQU1_07175 [Bryobacteraceae bacterium]